MNDTLTVKSLNSPVDADQYTALGDFARVSSSDDSQRRVNTALGLLSPTVLRINHRQPTATFKFFKTLVAIDQTLARVDALSNVLSKDSNKVAVQIERSDTTTEAESLASAKKLFGFLTENDWANYKALLRGEQ